MSIVERIDSVFQSVRFEDGWRKITSLIVTGKCEIKTVGDVLQVIVNNRLYRSFSVRTIRLEEHIPGLIDVLYRDDIIVSNTGEKKEAKNLRDVSPVSEGFIVNKFVVATHPDPKFNRAVHYIHFRCREHHIQYEDWFGGSDIYFVFDIEDTRKTYAAACNKLLTHLPPELVIQIAEHLGTTKSDFYYDIEYSEKDFPVNFNKKYKLQSIPEKLSICQLQKLYQLGVLQVGFRMWDNIILFTEESYDYDNGLGRSYRNQLHKEFHTKQDFLRKLEEIQSRLNRLFQS